ncbi:MAG: NDP-sugar synthase [Victivallaceae bacterium]|nr:NDP-sugar synthase [Victivallaceae bacterium]
MKCIISCPAAAAAWVGQYFYGMPRYLLPICNKPYLEYLIDFCKLNNISDIKIISDDADPQIERHFGDGSTFGVSLSYAASTNLRPGELMAHHFGAIAHDDLLMISGMFWLKYDVRDFKPLETPPDVMMSSANGEVMLIGRNFNDTTPGEFRAEVPELPLELTQLASIQDFYAISMRLVNGELVKFSVHSYKNVDHVYMGQNIALDNSADIIPPVVIDDVVQVSSGAHIGPAAIIGGNSFIDSDSAIRETVIMGNSYIGSNLELIGKIVYRNMVIDPKSGITLDIVDDFLLAQVIDTEHKGCDFIQRLGAFLLWMAQISPFLLLRPFVRIACDPVTCFLGCNEERNIKLKLYIKPANSLASRLFKKLSLDRFHLLGMVMRGRLRLVGNLLLAVTPANRKVLEQFPDYAPGLFSYSEMLDHANDPMQREMDELFYVYHETVGLNCRIIIKTLLRNLMKATG